MTNSIIQVPIKRIVEGKEFPQSETKRLDAVLKELEDARNPEYEPLYMPELIGARIDAPRDSRVWQTWWTTPSIRATGRTKQGNAVVVYAHIPNYLSKSENITNAINQGLVNYAGKMPQDEFQRLLDLEDGKRVFVVPYEDLRNSENKVIPLKKALEHPQTIPFLGGEDRAIRYLERYKGVYDDSIGIWHRDDLLEEPLARTLCVGGSFILGLGGDDYLGGYGRFLGVPKNAGEAPVH